MTTTLVVPSHCSEITYDRNASSLARPPALSISLSHEQHRHSSSLSMSPEQHRHPLTIFREQLWHPSSLSMSPEQHRHPFAIFCGQHRHPFAISREQHRLQRRLVETVICT